MATKIFADFWCILRVGYPLRVNIRPSKFYFSSVCPLNPVGIIHMKRRSPTLILVFSFIPLPYIYPSSRFSRDGPTAIRTFVLPLVGPHQRCLVHTRDLWFIPEISGPYPEISGPCVNMHTHIHSSTYISQVQILIQSSTICIIYSIY